MAGLQGSSLLILEVSPRGLLQNELVQRQIGDHLAPSRLFSSSRSFRRFTCSVQSTELLAPAIVGHFAHTNLADRVRHVLTLREQNVEFG